MRVFNAGKSQLLVRIAVVALLLLALLPSFATPANACASSGAPSVWTDKEDYEPGEVVTISGSGFACGVVLTVKVTRPNGTVVLGDGSFLPGSDTVTTDANGAFTYRYQLNGVLGVYSVDVIDAGGNVLASTTFTDSHGRFLHLTWQPVSGNTVEFIHTAAFRLNGYSCVNAPSQSWKACTGPGGLPGPGDYIVEWVGGTGLSFGDYTSTGTLMYLVTSIDVGGNWLFGQALHPGTTIPKITHTYSSSATRTASVSGCCRIGGLNNWGSSYSVSTIVHPGSTNRSPVSGLAPIVTVAKGGVQTWFIPASDPDNDPLRWRLSTSAESGNGSQPSGLTINATTGQISWDTTSKATGLYWNNITIEELNQSGTVKGKVAIDYLINVVASAPANNPPTFDSPTPANGTVLNVTAGNPVSFAVRASDSNSGDTVTLGAAGVPPGASFPIPTAANPVQSTFSWTPAAGQLGDYIVTFTATDNRGAAASPRSVTIRVTSGNQNPVCQPLSIVLDEDTPVTRLLPCTDPDTGDTIQTELVSLSLVSVNISPSSGVVPGGNVTLTPNANYNGNGGSFTYRARDNKGGLSNTATATIVVRPVNDAPALSLPANLTIDEGSSTSINLAAAVSDVETAAANIAWTVNSSDSGVATATIDPTGMLNINGIDGNGSAIVTVTATDRGDPDNCGSPSSTCDEIESTSQTIMVTVNNLAPTANLSNNGPIDEGGAATISFSNQADPSANDLASLHYVFDCNGGSLAGANYAAGSPSATANCSFGDNGSFNVSGKVMDKDGGSNEYQTTVVVNNVAPKANLSNNGPIDEGGMATVSFSGQSDPSANDLANLRYAFDCNGDSLAGVTYAAGSPNATADCTFGDNGSFNVSGKVMDKDGGSNEYQTTVVVNNVAPKANLSNNGPIDEGGAATVSFSGQSDPSANDLANLRYAFECNGGSLAGVNYAAGSPNAAVNCAFGDNGSFNVSGKVMDKDGGSNEYQTTVVVNNVAPAVDAGANAAIVSGQNAKIAAGFKDLGLKDGNWGYTIDWKDGSTSTGSSSGQGQGVIASSHRYFVPGSYAVSVCVTDKDGGKGCDDLTVEVRRLSVLIDIKPGSDPNSINRRNDKGNVPVGVFSGVYEGIAFDATTIDRSSLLFAGTIVLPIGKSPQELNADGKLDMVFHFDTQSLQLDQTSTSARLTGRTNDNVYFEGSDSVRIVH